MAILYGGSVNTSNASKLLEVQGIDGLFVGRAAWTVEGYLNLFSVLRRCQSTRTVGGVSS